MRRYSVFKIWLSHIHLGGCGLTVLIDRVASYLTTGSIEHVFPRIPSVIIRCMCVLNVYDCLMGSQLPKVTWGHSWASRIHILELEKPLWLVCIQCVPRMHVQELEKSLWLFCRYLWVLLGPVGPWLGWGLEFSLHHFLLGSGLTLCLINRWSENIHLYRYQLRIYEEM